MGELKRDQYGRYLLPDPKTGKERAWTRATTISGLLSDRYNLELWAQRMVALGLAARPDLLIGVKSTRDPNSYAGKRKLNGIVKQAKEHAGGSARANIGTAIHEAAESHDKGEPWDVGEPYNADVRAYIDKLASTGLRVIPGMVERITLNTELEIAGTFDRLLDHDEFRKMPAAWGGGGPRIADIKTGSTVSFAELEHAIQQAIYANAEWIWNMDAGEWEPMPSVDKWRALIVHCPAGEARCEITSLDIAFGWESAKVAKDVYNRRKAKNLSAPFGAE